MYDAAIKLINDAQKIVIIQPENPDGDSLGSALALEEILSDIGKDVVLFCAIDMPKYLQYIRGWDRVVKDWPSDANAAVIVDTVSEALLQQVPRKPLVLDISLNRIQSWLLTTTKQVRVIFHSKRPVLTIRLPSPQANSSTTLPCKLTGLLTFRAAENMFISIQADTLGLTTQGTTAASYHIAADLVGRGVIPADIEQRRREYMKKPADILKYKGQLIGRIEYQP